MIDKIKNLLKKNKYGRYFFIGGFFFFLIKGIFWLVLLVALWLGNFYSVDVT